MNTFVEELVETALRSLPGRWGLVVVGLGAGAMVALWLTQRTPLLQPATAPAARHST